MQVKTIQKRIKNLVVLGILSTGAVLAGTGCDLDNPATKGLLDSARILSMDSGGETRLGDQLWDPLITYIGDAPSTSQQVYYEITLYDAQVVSYN